MRMDLGMRSTSHYDSMPCMTVASLEMSDEPKKAEGVVLGRPKGSKNKRHKLSGKGTIINDLINNGISKTQIAKELQISRNLLYSFLKGMA